MGERRIDFGEIIGGAELCAWIGGSPAFADGSLLDMRFSIDGQASLLMRTWPLDPEGRYRNSEPILVTFELGCVSSVELNDFGSSAILDEVVITTRGDMFILSWQAAFGVEGVIQSKQIAVRFEVEAVGGQ